MPAHAYDVEKVIPSVLVTPKLLQELEQCLHEDLRRLTGESDEVIAQHYSVDMEDKEGGTLRMPSATQLSGEYSQKSGQHPGI
jgi:hypothetical protein